MIEYPSSQHENAPGKVVIIGLGGAGNNILNRIHAEQLPGCSICSVNLDLRQLNESPAPHKIHLGEALTHGLGSGGDPQTAARAANESESQLTQVLEGNDMLVLLTGLGGGTGSGAAPVIASIAREMGIFTITVATLPFSLEGKRRREQANEAAELLRDSADILLCFENDRVDTLLKGENKVLAAYEASNNLLAQVTRALPMLSARPGLFHLGLDDLKAVTKNNSYHCLFGYGEAQGEERAVRAAEQVLSCPLFISERGATDNPQILLHVTGPESLTIDEVENAVRHIAGKWRGTAHIHFGISILPEAGESIRIMAFAAEDASPAAALKEDEGCEEILLERDEEEKLVQEEVQPDSIVQYEDDLRAGPAEPIRPLIIETEEDPVDFPDGVLEREIASSQRDTPEEEEPEPDTDLPFPEREVPPVKDEPVSAYARPSRVQDEGMFKGLFEEDEPFIVDGEDLDLPPSMRKKK